MKISLITNVYGRDARGGAEVLVQNVFNGLKRGGHDPFVISLRPWGKASVEDRTYYLGSAYPLLSRFPKVLRLLFHAKNVLNPVKYFQVKKILKKERADIIMTHNLTGFGFLLFRLFKNKKHIHTAHDIQLLHPSGLLIYNHESMLDSLVAKVYRAIIRSTISPSTKVVFPSHWLEQLHVKYGMFTNNEREIITNPYPSFAKASEGKPEDEIFRFFFVGQIEEHKGVRLLIDAFRSLPGSNLRLTLIGNGSLLDELKKATDNRITFLGRQPKEKVLQTMQDSDCLVVPSLCYENQPTVILEAQAVGLPVIASNLGGIPEMLNSDNVCIEPTFENLATALKTISSQEKKATVSTAATTPAAYVTALLSL